MRGRGVAGTSRRGGHPGARSTQGGKVRRATILTLVAALLLAVTAGVAVAKDIRGTNGPDILAGTNNADKISALSGKDEVRGLRGPDVLNGGTGPDLLQGNRGDDTIKGAPGDDTVIGNEN